MTACGVVATLDRLFKQYGAQRYLRSDNGPEFIAHAVKDWLAQSGVGTLYIELGAPWQNAYSESFNSRSRDELLDREIFTTLAEASVLAEEHFKYLTNIAEQDHQCIRRTWRAMQCFALFLLLSGRLKASSYST